MSEEKQFNKATAQPLLGCVSFETAYIQPDYPYGRRLRCKRAVWVETHPRHGQRFCTRTTNPKAYGEKWNKTHASTYTEGLKALWVDDKGYVATDGVSAWSDLETIKAWGERNKALLDFDEYSRNTFTAMVMAKEAHQKRLEAGEVTYTVRTYQIRPGQGVDSSQTTTYQLLPDGGVKEIATPPPAPKKRLDPFNTLAAA